MNSEQGLRGAIRSERRGARRRRGNGADGALAKGFCFVALFTAQWHLPALADAYFDKGVSSFNKRQYANAVQYLSTYVGTHPNDPDALYYLGASYQGVGDY